MKYAFAVVILAVVVAAMLMLGPEDSSRGDTGASRPAATSELIIVATPEPTVVAHPEPTIVGLPTLHVPEVSVADAVVTSEEAVATARSFAATMREYDPVLIDAILTTQADVRDRLRPAGATRTEGPSPRSSGISDGAGVWLVRMRGEFGAPSYPGPELPPPVKGWMIVVVNASNGQWLGYGHEPESERVR